MTRPRPSQPELARVVARLSADYLLRALRLVSDLQGGDLMEAVILQAIIAANTSHLAQPAEPGADPSVLPPDEARKPISILALAGSLGQPFETTRRYVNRLIKSGACQRVKGGLIVPATVLADARFHDAAEINLAYVQHFVRGLRRVGLDIE